MSLLLLEAPKLDIFAKKNCDTQNDSSTKKESHSQLHTKKHPESIICCKNCRQIITKDEFSMVVDGYHEHLQCNPHGFTFVFRCFREVWHVAQAGPPCLKDSWFPGFYWTIVHCNQCFVHLGWQFSTSPSPTKGDVFWGLLTDRLSHIRTDP
ncbi:cereblon family protein [Litoribacillus peritrichatus]|uniref:cereblon family protein n=1 Tax=Litoribacillus peritrichatus TaxID=718191 RepID=UPI0031D99DDD